MNVVVHSFIRSAFINNRGLTKTLLQFSTPEKESNTDMFASTAAAATVVEKVNQTVDKPAKYGTIADAQSRLAGEAAKLRQVCICTL